MKNVVVVCAFALALSIAPIAFADAYDAAMAEGVAAREKAVDSNDPAVWEDALRAFEKADEARPTKESKYEMANAAAHLKADDLAVEAYEAALALGISGSAKTKATAFVEANAPKMARLTFVGADGTRVTIDDRLRATLPSPKPIVVFAGKLHVVATATNGATTEKAIEATAGETKTIDLTAPTTNSTTNATTNATTTGAPPPIAETPKNSAPSSSRSGAWALTIGGGALFVVGIGTTILATSKISSDRDALGGDCFQTNGSDQCLYAQPGRTSAAQGDVDGIATWKAMRIGGVVAAGVGVVGVIVGVVKLARGEATTTTTSTGWTPTFDLSARGGALGVKGSF